MGLATALLVAKQGHDVTVLERDPEPPPKTPGEANGAWDRPSVMRLAAASCCYQPQPSTLTCRLRNRHQ